MPAPTRPEQIGRLQVFLDEKALNQKTDILSGFDLGQMAAKELGVGEQDFANHLPSLQRFVEERFDRI
jgi:hypothetical protein